MEDKKLRRIGKKKLLEIMLSQAKRIEELEYKLEKTQKKLDSKKVMLEDSGSIADATVKLSGLFESAQETADLYLANVKDKCKKIESDAKKEAQVQVDKMLEDATKKCEELEKETNKKLKATLKEIEKLTKEANKL